MNTHQDSTKASWGTVVLQLFGTSILLGILTVNVHGQLSSPKRVKVRGELVVAYEDSDSSSNLRYFLKANGKHQVLQFTIEPPSKLKTGDQVIVSGVQLDSHLLVDALSAATSTKSGTTSQMVTNNSFGEHKVLTILVNFQDKQDTLFTQAYARDMVFTQTNNFFRENSFNQTWLTGDVFGWLTIPASYTTCDPLAIAAQAKAAAAAAGADLSAYNHYVYWFPANACMFVGMSTVGGNPSEIWLKGQRNLKIVAHELGHSFGLVHSRSWDCGPQVTCPNGVVDEYGDNFDIMGNADSAHFNLVQKERLGWINYGMSPPLTTVTTSGNYWIDSYAGISANAKGLKILKSTDPATGARSWYYLEHRTTYGFDSCFAGNTNVLNGVLVHQGSESDPQTVYLLDLTTVTDSWMDPALTVGQSFADLDAGLVITILSADSMGAMVSVSLGPLQCYAANPTVALSTGPAVAAGSAVSYTVTVTNNDSIGCSADTFALQASVPSDWSSSLGQTTLSINPGASATTTLVVTSPVSALSGTYSVGMTASELSEPAYSGSATGTYVITSPPSVTVSSSQARYLRNQTAMITALVSANGNAVAGASVSFTMTRSNSSTVKGSGTTSGNGVASFKYTIRKKDPTGTYQILAKTTVNGIVISATTSFVIE
ncbi:MAG TPA: NEW3 domain-containing protein [Pyrinomonadaceae bacterium]|nr:NEW3 domain-containing protein [Pyrinomonadaceae bacterium]